MNNNDSKSDHLDEVLDDSVTDELPVLTPAALARMQIDDDDVTDTVVNLGESLAADIEDMRETLRVRDRKLAELNVQLSSRVDEVEALHEVLRGATAGKVSLAAEAQALRQTLDSVEAVVQSKQSELDAANAALARANQELTELRQEFENSERKIIELGAQAAEGEAVANERQQSIDRLKAEMLELQATLRDREVGIGNLRSQLADRQGELELLEEDFRVAVADGAERATEIDSLQVEIDARDLRLAENDDALAAANEALELITKNLEISQGQLEKSQRDAAEAQALVEETQATLATSRDQVTELNTALEQSTEALRVRDLDIGALRSSLEESQSNLSTMRSDLDTTIAAKGVLESELAALQTVADSTQKQLLEQSQALASESEGLRLLTEKSNAKETELAEVRGELAQTCARLITQESIAADRAVDLNRLDVENQSLKERIQELGDYIDGRKDHWSAQEDRVVRLKKALEAKDLALTQLHSDAQRDQATIEKVQRRAAILFHGSQQRLHRNRRIETELENGARELTILQAAIEEQRQAAAEQLHFSESQQQRIDALVAELTDASAAIEGLTQKNEGLTQCLLDLDRQVAAERELTRQHESALRESQAAIDDGRLQLSNSQAALVDAERKIADAQSESANARTAANEATTELQARDKRIGELEGQLHRYEDELALLSGQLQAQVEENDALRHQIEQIDSDDMRLETVISDLSSQYWERQKKIDDLTAKLSAVQKDNEQLRNQLVRRSSRSASAEREGESPSGLQVVPAALVSRDSEVGMRRKGDPELKEAVRKSWNKNTNDQRITRILVSNEADREIRYPIFGPVMTIGRHKENDIEIRQPSVSRRHARVMLTERGSYIEDLGSKNGIFVNSARVKNRLLRHGDVVSIGSSDFTFVELAEKHPFNENK